MESYSLENVLQNLYSDSFISIENMLNYLLKKCTDEEFKSIIKNKKFNLVQLFTKESNLKSKKIAIFLPDILTKISIYTHKNIIESFNNCGACFLCVFFNIIQNIPSLEGKFYSFLISYLGDYDGDILEKKSIKICAERTYNIFNKDLNNNNIEYCHHMEKGEWCDYIEGMGKLFINDLFVEKIKNNPKGINQVIENFIKEKNCFNKNNADELINFVINIIK